MRACGLDDILENERSLTLMTLFYGKENVNQLLKEFSREFRNIGFAKEVEKQGYAIIHEMGVPDKPLHCYTLACTFDIVVKHTSFLTMELPPERMYVLCLLGLEACPRRLQKGDAVRALLERARVEGRMEACDLIIYVDGEGFKLGKTLFPLFNKLREHADVVLGCRTPGSLGIEPGPERSLVELLELYVVSRALGLERILPDGQCGAWGFKGHIGSRLVRLLMAHGFEIELDILIESLLTKGAEVHFVPVSLREAAGQKNSPERAPLRSGTIELTKVDLHKTKSAFLASKFRLAPACLETLIDDFENWLLDGYKDIRQVFTSLPQSKGDAEKYIGEYKRHVLNAVVEELERANELARKQTRVPARASEEEGRLFLTDIYFRTVEQLPVIPKQHRAELRIPGQLENMLPRIV